MYGDAGYYEGRACLILSRCLFGRSKIEVHCAMLVRGLEGGMED
jgi:hypothetical protein